MIIWTMKEYGVAESWSKDILLGSWFPRIDLQHLLPLTTFPNGDILFSKLGCDLVSFSPKTKQCTIIPFRDTHLVIYASLGTTYAPRFYALEEDVSGRKHHSTHNVWLGILSRVLVGILLPFSVNGICGFVNRGSPISSNS
ncbi:hypothetical protein CDL12_02509 [Handroanthus impetiginosus]|uniref:F-box associated domain-containing protein n=1 Tax=Handroanthus impetiginosus TaxID=429701 RepID=A0A2G9I4U1_9LAMI|nr:hypothetical protein CDL12_26631 [Handroanthus impetiginosus]PIN24764.1 hypothetical protein CDL12_02509 [Handroanthus impetiginosus]